MGSLLVTPLSPTLLPQLSPLLPLPLSVPLLTPLWSRPSSSPLLRSATRSLPTTFLWPSATPATTATPSTDKLFIFVSDGVGQTCHRFILPRNPDLVLYCSHYYHCCCCCFVQCQF